jgi:hypothetical protein
MAQMPLSMSSLRLRPVLSMYQTLAPQTSKHRATALPTIHMVTGVQTIQSNMAAIMGSWLPGLSMLLAAVAPR